MALETEAFHPGDKVLDISAAAAWREEMRRLRKRVVLTNGCFDLLHRGHAEYLLAARSLGDALILLLNSDESVRALKGPSRPVCREEDRAFLLACFSFVDAVTVFHGDRCSREIRLLKPDIYVKGGDYTLEKLDPGERSALLESEAEIHFIPFVAGFYTSGLIAKASEKAS